jgi:hypothetical protein
MKILGSGSRKQYFWLEYIQNEVLWWVLIVTKYKLTAP